MFSCFFLEFQGKPSFYLEKSLALPTQLPRYVSDPWLQHVRRWRGGRAAAGGPKAESAVPAAALFGEHGGWEGSSMCLRCFVVSWFVCVIFVCDACSRVV